MAHAGDFSVASCQATLFTPDYELSPARFVTRFLAEWAARFDAEPTVIPLPDEVPKEIPKIILESKDRQWRCEVASARVNLFWRRQAVGVQIGLPEFYQTALPLLLQYRDFSSCPIRRLAAVVNRFVVDDEPARYLARHFCQERWLAAPFNRPENFELHSHKRFQLIEGITANSWVRNKTGRLRDTNSPIVLVEQDLNTLAEETDRNFGETEIRRFFERASTEFDTILSLYFPADLP